jgi:putative CocE/NonD family hydrolase
MLAFQNADAHASVVEHGYFPLGDGTRLSYTLTRPSAEGRFPVVLKYDPYSAGVTSDPTWNDSGYAMLGVNFRGTGCSYGEFQPLRTDIWGKDGAEAVAWAAGQPWSDGNIGMIGYSFTGVSQLATAAFAGPALKAISPGNVFPDLYRDMVYPGGIHNAWTAAWIAGRNVVPGLGADAFQHSTSDPECAAAQGTQAAPDDSHVADMAAHPYLDDFWATRPDRYMDRVHIPVLGCVNWQDVTVYSHAFTAFREQLDPRTTWLVGANGTHTDCPTSRARLVRFFDRYLKQKHAGWEATPHLLLVHELTGKTGVREKLGDNAGAWQSGFATWAAVNSAIHPLALHLEQGGRLGLAPPAQAGSPDSYDYPTPTANTPSDFGGNSAWKNPTAPGGGVAYTTPALAHDAEFLGSGSADLWVSSSAPDTDVQVTLTEVRPDGQETYVENGWLRMSHRRLDAARSTELRPYHSYRQADTEQLTPGKPELARIELLPFDHVFRAGSALRLSIDAPGGYFQITPTPATNSVFHQPGMDSKLVLGWLPGATAHAPLPACDALLNQPCRPSATPVPPGSLTIPAPAGSPSEQALEIGRTSGLRHSRRGHPFSVAVRATGGEIRNARVVLRDAAGRRLGASRRFTAGTSPRTVRIRVTRRLRSGRYTLTVTGLAANGVRITSSKGLRVK